MNTSTHTPKKNNREKLTQSQESELMSLVELQDFLHAELAEQGVGYKRAFTPLSEGLGLESPRHNTPQVMIPFQAETLEKMGREDSASDAPKFVQSPSPVDDQELYQFPKTEEIRRAARTTTRPENSLASVMESPVPPVAPSTRKQPLSKQAIFSSIDDMEIAEAMDSSQSAVQSAGTMPPPLPRPSVVRRLLAGIMDQIFVLLLWTVALLVTSNVMSDFKTGFSVAMLSDFSKPLFQRIATMEFAAIWFGYLGFSLLIFNRTFGMWVWGISVSYGDSDGKNHFMRRIMRVIWGFVFTAPIFTSLLLVIRRNGRNILDVLSGTNVYDAA